MTLLVNPNSGKPDNNTPPTNSARDEFPGSLGERQARAYRPEQSEHRGTALAVVNGDGSALGASSEQVMRQMLYELRALRLGMILAGTCVVVADIDDLGGVF